MTEIDRLNNLVVVSFGVDLKEYLANLEKDLIGQALDDSGGVVARAADRLNIRRTTLVEKMRKYNLQKKPSDDSGEVVDSETGPGELPTDKAASA